jgi:hypothetical protein
MPSVPLTIRLLLASLCQALIANELIAIDPLSLSEASLSGAAPR